MDFYPSCFSYFTMGFKNKYMLFDYNDVNFNAQPSLFK